MARARRPCAFPCVAQPPQAVSPYISLFPLDFIPAKSQNAPEMADSDSLGSSPSSTPHQASGHQTKVRPLTSKLTYGVLSDTHGSIPSEIYEIFQGVQCIFHCGDIGSSGQIAELETLAPLLLVRGNMDWNLSPIYEESLITSVEFGTVAMAHGTRHGHYNESIIKGPHASIRPPPATRHDVRPLPRRLPRTAQRHLAPKSRLTLPSQSRPPHRPR